MWVSGELVERREWLWDSTHSLLRVFFVMELCLVVMSHAMLMRVIVLCTTIQENTTRSKYNVKDVAHCAHETSR